MNLRRTLRDFVYKVEDAKRVLTELEESVSFLSTYIDDKEDIRSLE